MRARRPLSPSDGTAGTMRGTSWIHADRAGDRSSSIILHVLFPKTNRRGNAVQPPRDIAAGSEVNVMGMGEMTVEALDHDGVSSPPTVSSSAPGSSPADAESAAARPLSRWATAGAGGASLSGGPRDNTRGSHSVLRGGRLVPQPSPFRPWTFHGSPGAALPAGRVRPRAVCFMFARELRVQGGSRPRVGGASPGAPGSDQFFLADDAARRSEAGGLRGGSLNPVNVFGVETCGSSSADSPVTPG